MKYFKCMGREHIASQCPNRRTMILREDGGFETEEDSDEESKQPLGEDMKMWSILLLGSF